MKKLIKIITFIGCILLVILEAGCSKNDSRNETNNQAEETVAVVKKEGVTYIPTSVAIENWAYMLNQWIIDGDTIYDLNYETNNEERQVYYYINVRDSRGQEKERIDIPLHSGALMNCTGFQKSKSADFWILASNFSENETEEVPYHLMKVAVDGTIQTDIVVDELTGITDGNYVQMVQDSNGVLYFLETTKNIVVVMEDDGTLKGIIELGDIVPNLLLTSKDGTIYIGLDNGTKTSLWGISEENLVVSNQEEILPVGNLRMLQGGLEKDFIGVTSTGLIECSVGDTQAEELMNWTENGITRASLLSMRVYGDNTVAMVSYEEGKETMDLMFIVGMEGVKEKTVITIATFMADYNLTDFVVAYNKEHTDIKLEIKEYYDKHNGYDEVKMQDAVNRLNTDIVEKKAGDILDVGSLREFTSRKYYVDKGVLENLYDWMEKDSDINKEDFIPNLLAANEINGGLYDLVPSFNITTMAGKTSIVGNGDSWTLEEAKDSVTKEENLQLFGYGSKSEFLRLTLLYNQGSFIDDKQGTCQFDSELFKKYVEYANTFPYEEEYDESVSGWNNLDKTYAGEVVLYNSIVDGIVEGIRQAWAIFGEEVTFIGFPSEEGIGSAFVPVLSLGVFSDSEQKEASWQVLKTLLESEYQNSRKRDIPAIQSAMEQHFKRILEENPSSMDGFGSYTFEVIYGDVKERHIEQAKDLISKTTVMEEVDENIYGIILEEAEYYFKGEKSLDEVCNLIQNRVSIYLKEQK